MAPLNEQQIAEGLDKKRILVVGGTAGIGKAVAEGAIKRGAQVTIIGRRQPSGLLLQKNSATFIQKDLQLMKNASELASQELDLTCFDIVLFTNGITTTPVRKQTSEGVELDLAVSYLSRLAIAQHFKGVLGNGRADKTRKPRVFVMGFPGKKNSADLDDFNSDRNYSAMAAHLTTVVANEALVTYLNTQYPELNAYGLNPGLIKTEIRNNFLGAGSWLSMIVETLIGFFLPVSRKLCGNCCFAIVDLTRIR